MKALFGSLLCLVFTVAQCFALGGGPNYGGPGVTTTGIYAGVMTPGDLSPGANSLGLFSVTIPKTGLGTGTVIIFNVGETYTGTFTGIADPDSAQLTGEVDAEFPYTYSVPSGVTNGVTTYTTVTVVAKAAGKLTGQLAANTNVYSSASVRLTGSADVQFSLSVNNPFNEIVYDVIGFKQAEASS
ncbi:MAG: hypothetical protein JO354_07575 [Verrucomicrobia bacterium]|nr:hypothetical protein [Verrucomicrobiota bacterium]